MRSEKRSAPCSIVIALTIGAAACESTIDQTKATVADGSSSTRTAEAGVDWAAPADGTPPTFFPTFYAVYYELLVPKCGAFCHASSGYFSLGTPELAYRTLVGVRSTSGTCGSTGILLVAPGKPDASLLYQKITSPKCGLRMPASFGGGVPLPEKQTRQVRDWILRGARFDGGPNDHGPYDAGSEDAAISPLDGASEASPD